MRCALYLRSSTRTRQSIKTQPISVTRITSSTSSGSVKVVSHQSTMTRQSTRSSQQDYSTTTRSTSMTSHKPVRNETVRRPSGGRHLQPPVGNNAKLKHECPFDGCPWRFATPYKLRRHIKSHTKETPYQCKECGRGFSVRYNLLMHIQTIHSAPHKYRCPITGCKEAFHTQPRLNGHLRRVHKKDWKQLQTEQQEQSPSSKETNETDSVAGSPCSSDSSTHDISKTQSSLRWFKCIDCGKAFSSQAKLSAHMRTHAGNRSFKCSIEGCNKSFPSSEKLLKHLDTHKNAKNFACPHEDCRRVFVRQSHLKNHLKAHAGDKLTCPVPDCGCKFSNEADYNDHLHVHMGYSIPCPHPQCNLSFPTQKRLELHCRVAHDIDCITGISIPPLLFPMINTFPSENSTKLNHPQNDSKTETLGMETRQRMLGRVIENSEFIESLELPDLKVEDVEAVISEHTDWSGEQIEGFLRSLDLGELECGGSLSGYESDSGYSTYEVSPLASSVTATHYGSALSPAITPVTPTPVLPSSSISSPIPFCPFQEDLFSNAISKSFLSSVPVPQPLSATSTLDGNFFSASDLPLLPTTPTDTLSEHSFPLPTSYQHVDVTQTPHFHIPPQYQQFPMTMITAKHPTQPIVAQFPIPTKIGVQSVLPATSNLSTIEDSKHKVVVIPNVFGIPPQLPPHPSCSSVRYAPSSCSATFLKSEMSKPHVSGITGQFSCAVSENSQKMKQKLEECNKELKPDKTVQSNSTSISNVDQKHVLLPEIKERINSIMKPKPESEKSPQCRFSEGSEKISTNGTEKTPEWISTLAGSKSDLLSLSPEGARMVFAQILSSPSSSPSAPSMTSARSEFRIQNSRSSGKGKFRQRSNTVPMKASQRKGKSTWPKSMNSGNLMAFRNFILSKLKKGKEVTECNPDSSDESVRSLDWSSTDQIMGPLCSRNACFSSDSSCPSSFLSLSESTKYEELLSEINFNPDTLLASDGTIDCTSLSPFSRQSGSISPSPVPLSPGLETSLQFASLSSLTSDSPSSLADTNMGFDGYVQFLSVDPLSQSLSDPNPSSTNLNDDLDHIFKTDADPLLGAFRNDILM